MSHPAPIVVLSPGHSRASKGAVSVGGVSEWDYMTRVCDLAVARLTGLGISTARVDRGTHGIPALVREIERLRPVVAVELHFNAAASSQAHGCETLYAADSETGLSLAKHIQRRMMQAGGTRDRGTLAIRTGERGAGYLVPLSKRMACALIEPFFGSNPAEWLRFQSAHNAIANALAVGVVDYLTIHNPHSVPRFAVDIARIPLQPLTSS